VFYLEQLSIITRSNATEPLTDFEQVRRKISTEGEYSLSFLITRTERNAAVFDQIENKAKIILDSETYIIDDVERDSEGTTVMKQVDAKHEMFDRLKSVTVKQEYKAQKQLSAWLDIVMAGSGLTYEISGSFPSEQFDNFGMNNGLELFKDLISRFGVEYRPYGNTIFIAKTIGEVTEAQFRHAHNLRTFSDSFNTDDVVTRVIAYGKADEDTGKPLVSVTVESSNINAYDRVYEYVFQDERFTDKASLVEYAKTFLSDGKYSAKLEYEEIIKNAVKLHNFGVGDYVYVIYELAGMEINLQARVMSMEDNPFDQMFSPVLEIGSFVPDVTKRIRDQLKTGERVTRLEGNVTVVSQTATKASQDAAKALEDTGGYSQTLTQHVNNSVIHVTDEDRRRWDTAAEEAGTAPTKESIGLGNVDNIKQAAKTDFDLHVQDLTAHWTQEQRDQLEGILVDYGRRIAVLEGGGA
jgi:phage minor structural protein